MRCAFASLVGLLLLGSGCGSGGGHVISAHGVKVVVPDGWSRVRPANDAPVTDPSTLLVVGTPGVRARPSRCQIAAYHIPAQGAVVVIVGWTSVAAAGGVPKAGRSPLERLVAVTKPSFECFAGRGAVANVLLGGKPYQVNILAGDHASKERVDQALAVGRSFDRTG
jgi:hypothetical protein